MKQSRVVLFASAKAVGIVLVTIGHAEPVLFAFPEVFKTIYSFHMPLFFFLTGVFANRLEPLTSVSYLKYVKRQIKTLGVPYLFISVVFAAAKASAPGSVKRPVHFNELLKDVFIFPSDAPALFLWFIYTLFIVRLAWPFVCRAPALLVLLILAPFQFFNIDIPVFLLGYVFYYMTYFWLGALAAKHMISFVSLLKRLDLLAIAALVFIAANIVGAHHDLPPPLRLPVALCGTFLVFYLCRACESVLSGRIIDMLDRRSFEIYLLQFFFIFPATYVCRRLGLADGATVALEILLGLAGPLAVVQIGLITAPRATSLLLGTKLKSEPHVRPIAPGSARAVGDDTGSA